MDDPRLGYLWNHTGPEDPFVARLERALAPTRARLRRLGPRRPPWLLVGLPFGVVAAAAAAWLLAQSMAEAPRVPDPAPAVAIESPSPETAGVR